MGLLVAHGTALQTRESLQAAAGLARLDAVLDTPARLARIEFQVSEELRRQDGGRVRLLATIVTNSRLRLVEHKTLPRRYQEGERWEERRNEYTKPEGKG